MPRKPPSPCRHPGCPVLVDGGRCSQHHKPRPSADRRRPNSNQRGYGYTWHTKVRPIILSRDPVCKGPGRDGSGCDRPSRHVDHIVPKEDGGTDDPSNLQGLCPACHSRKTVRQDGGFGRRDRGPRPPGVGGGGS